MGSGTRIHNLVNTVVVAEATVVIHDLQFALDLRSMRVILKSDSRLVIQNIQRTGKDYLESRSFTWMQKIWRGSSRLAAFSSLLEMETLLHMQWLRRVCDYELTRSGRRCSNDCLGCG